MEISMINDKASFSPRRQVRVKAPNKRLFRSFWIKALIAFSKSGLSVQQFCRLNSISPSNFYAWRKRLREEEADTPPAPATFIPLELMLTAPSSDLPKEILQNQQLIFSPDIEKEGSDSGLTLHVNKDLKISIDKKFHEPTLQRLIQLFSLGNSSPC
jgi:transposase-like protein